MIAAKACSPGGEVWVAKPDATTVGGDAPIALTWKVCYRTKWGDRFKTLADDLTKEHAVALVKRMGIASAQ